MIAIFGAFGQEIVNFRRQMVVEEVVSMRACKVYRGKFKNKDTILVQTGMGKERAENATRFALERYPVTAIISLGFAGGLAPELKIGDVVVCSTLLSALGTEQKMEKLEPLAPDAYLLSLASQGCEDGITRFCAGSGVTVLELDSNREKMKQLNETFNAHIVDMESYWIARIASTARIPFIAIRSISDNIQSSVQPFDQILSSDGKLLWRKAVLCFISHPQYFVNVFTLYRNSRLAKRNLSAFVGQLVSRI
ncbi:MAG TPA: 5'-methylthioadenosine/S-adenosylhomocysteine nucleosidase [Dehalococcoidia bacterium]|nr:5'-methylthioadenosine/S-adenosylhomocysteine nucleosidase [Dehalococcoidia bacterium]